MNDQVLERLDSLSDELENLRGLCLCLHDLIVFPASGDQEAKGKMEVLARVIQEYFEKCDREMKLCWETAMATAGKSAPEPPPEQPKGELLDELVIGDPESSSHFKVRTYGDPALKRPAQ